MSHSVKTLLRKKLFAYFSLSGVLVPQSEAETEIRDGISFRGVNILILITAIFIASLGLNTNSTAVIIGAMLISPLMGPIVGIGLGVGICDFILIKRSAKNLAMATLFSVLTSTIYFLISPVSASHSELLARTSPTIYDVLIAFFGGAAGILAAGSRYKGNVIPGVAIATALMPPLCTAGYGLGTWQLHYFFGAFYLFLINSVYIALATFIGVKLMHYHTSLQVDPDRARRVRRATYTVAFLVLLPSIWLTFIMLRQNNFQKRAETFIEREFRFPATQVVSQRAYFDGGKRVIQVTLIGRILPVDSLQLAMQPKLKQFGLQGTRLNIIQGDVPTLNTPEQSSAKDIYQMAQATITGQQQIIDSLRAVNASRIAADTVSAAIAPEIKVLFPGVADLAVSRAIFVNTNTNQLDTTTLALVQFSTPMSAATRQRFKKYLEARLQLRDIDIVPTTVPGSRQ